jgi:hypothetical protein
MQLLISPTGSLRCIYSEEIELTALGNLSISRASHVEPDAESNWFAELMPVNGPKLGPFSTRSQALKAEQAWLERYWLQ